MNAQVNGNERNQGSVLSAPPVDLVSEVESGLTSEEAAKLLKLWGPNDPVPVVRHRALTTLILLLLNPLAVILLIAALFSALLGQAVDATIILVMVLLGIALNLVQTYRSQRAVESLRSSVRTTASVLRDQHWQEIPKRELVPGDLVRLEAGDMVPADAVLVQDKDLYVQQAALTGESLPVEKEVGRSRAQTADPNAAHMVFLGTSVISGFGLARVSATGPKTAFGGIAARLAERPQETEFEKGLRRFGYLIMRVVLILVVSLIGLSIVLRHDPFESLLFAVALAVGLTPEFLPMITSVTLANGAAQMARKKVIVKRLPAIQNLGSIDVLCSDKTGTLTAGVMRLTERTDPFGEPSDDVFLFGYLNSKFETGLHNPLNAAILEQPCPAVNEYGKCDEIPFDFERRCISVVVEHDGQHLLILKGAPESVIERSISRKANDGVRPFLTSEKETSLNLFRAMGAKGYRTLGVAFKPLEKRSAYGRSDETDLVFAGYLSFADPPRADAAATINSLHRDGVQLKVLTGDNDLVTRYVCDQVGLDAGGLVLGEDLARMTDPALDHVVEQTHVFARLSPAQKNRVVLALKRRSHVVGYLGDGINDAPALHSADVGISVDGAADVAREAADIILVEPSLNVLHAGILEGRKASANVLKYLLMGTSSNFGNMLSMASASLVLPFLPMLPTQILLNNFLYDVAQISIPTDNVDAKYLRAPHRWSMRFIQKFMLLVGPISSLYDFVTFYVLLTYFHASQSEFHTGWFVESLATQTLVLLVIRTSGNPIQSRPSLPLCITVFGTVLISILIPLSPLAAPLGFVALPGSFFVFLALVTALYLVSVELVKRSLFREVQ